MKKKVKTKVKSELVFDIGGKLPYICEAVFAIFSYAPGGKPTAETVKRKTAINSYTTALINIWARCFGSQYIQVRKVVAHKLRNYLKSYYNSVINVGANSPASKLTQRQINLNWRSQNEVLLDIFKKGVNIDDEMIFNNETRGYYYAQKQFPLRLGYVSDLFDETYVLPAEHYVEENVIENNPPEEVPEQDLNQSLNRSGFSCVRKSVTHQQIQTDKVILDQPEIRGVRKCTDDIKRMCTQVSIECGISLEKSRKSVQVVARELYNHEYRLEPPSPQNNVESQVSAASENCEPPPKRRAIKWTSDLKDRYRWVIPSRSVLIDWKHLQATEAEIAAAIALFHKQEDVR